MSKKNVSWWRVFLLIGKQREREKKKSEKKKQHRGAIEKRDAGHK